jgi:glycine cleavage system H protein
MSNIPEDLHYTREHEWARVDADGNVVIGITDYAQSSLGEIVYVELPEVGDGVTREEAFGVVESTKSVSDLLAPISGNVTETNGIPVDNPEVCNEDPYAEGWMVKIEPLDPSELDTLMGADEYEEYVSGLSS